MIDFFLCRLTDDEPAREQTHRSRLLAMTPRLLMEDLGLIDLDADRLRHFAIVAMTRSDSIYTHRNKADNRVKWKEAVDFLK